MRHSVLTDFAPHADCGAGLAKPALSPCQRLPLSDLARRNPVSRWTPEEQREAMSGAPTREGGNQRSRENDHPVWQHMLQTRSFQAQGVENSEVTVTVMAPLRGGDE